MNADKGRARPPGAPRRSSDSRIKSAAGPAVLPYLGAWAACLLFCATALAFGAPTAAALQNPWQTRLPAFSTDGPPRGEAPILLYFTAPWCGFCKQMERTTLADAEVAAQIGKLRAHKIDHDSQGGLVERFGVRGIPAFVLTNNRGEVLDRLTGASSKEEFLKWLANGRTSAVRAALSAEERAAALARVAADMLSTDEAVRARALTTCWELAGRGDDFERKRATENLEALLGSDSGASMDAKAAWLRVGLAHEDLAVRVAAANLMRTANPQAAESYDPWADEAGRKEAAKRIFGP